MAVGILMGPCQIARAAEAPVGDRLSTQFSVAGTESDPVVATLDAEGKGKLKIGFINTGQVAAKISVVALLQDKQGVNSQVGVALDGDDTVLGTHASSVVVSLRVGSAKSALPLSGSLVWKATGKEGIVVGQGYRRLVVQRPLVLEYLHWVLWAPLLVAVGIVGVAWGVIRRQSDSAGSGYAGTGVIRVSDEMGLPLWDFSRSWASNLTAAGAIFGTVIALVIMPDQTQMLAKQVIVGLHLLFLGLIGAAPFVYNAVRKGVFSSSASVSSDDAYHGYVGMFLVACVITIWGVIGQMASLFLLIREIRTFGMWPGDVTSIFQASLVLLSIALVPYLIQSIYWGVRSQIVQVPLSRASGPVVDAATPVAVPRTNIRQLSKWSLL
jgi:hypothetical protein